MYIRAQFHDKVGYVNDYICISDSTDFRLGGIVRNARNGDPNGGGICAACLRREGGRDEGESSASARVWSRRR